MNLATQLLPSQDHLQLQNYELDTSKRQIKVFVESIQKMIRCPVCDQIAHRVHSHYERTLADLPWADYQIVIRLAVSKFFCDHASCKRRVFTERMGSVMAPWARRTKRLAEQLSEIALRTGGVGGAKLSQKLHCEVSRNTLLSLIYRQPMPPVSTPKTLGVDDFAFRRGARYGTILVDLDQQRPIVLLADREAETLAQWLREHPGVEVLSRDRSKTYRQGMTQGAPGTPQVADRFHLLKNLAEVLERILANHSQQLKAVGAAQSAEMKPSEPSSQKPASSTPVQSIEADRLLRAEQRRERRFAHYKQIHQLRQQGWEVLAIARHLGMGERTVYRYLSAPSFPEWQPRHDQGKARYSHLNPYKAYLNDQWNQGRQFSKALFAEIQQQGYRGSYMTVTRYTHQLRQQQRQARQASEGYPQSQLSHPQSPGLTARRATWIVMRRDEHQTEADRALVAQIKQQHPDIATAIQLTQAFTKLVREQLPQELDGWLEQATNSSVVPFQRFAQGLKDDYAAVKESLKTWVSNGPVEGQINRLKLLKRQMYGRASFELLHRRFILTS